MCRQAQRRTHALAFAARAQRVELRAHQRRGQDDPCGSELTGLAGGERRGRDGDVGPRADRQPVHRRVRQVHRERCRQLAAGPERREGLGRERVGRHREPDVRTEQRAESGYGEPRSPSAPPPRAGRVQRREQPVPAASAPPRAAAGTARSAAPAGPAGDPGSRPGRRAGPRAAACGPARVRLRRVRPDARGHDHHASGDGFAHAVSRGGSPRSSESPAAAAGSRRAPPSLRPPRRAG